MLRDPSTFLIRSKLSLTHEQVYIFGCLPLNFYFNTSGFYMVDFSKLQNIYWRIRFQRNKNLKRKYYRYAAAEKKRLIASGVDPEELRLLCRALVKQHCEHAERRLKAYRSKVTQDPISSSIYDDGNCQ